MLTGIPSNPSSKKAKKNWLRKARIKAKIQALTALSLRLRNHLMTKRIKGIIDMATTPH